ncbi:MAG TPA: N-acetylmuramic acid 6-phosphate etherase [Acidobacteriota bacterium]|nr:N-acetylmuramic acid 6-phosphate etherase [Acidobacteriota bacterium]
MDTTLLYEQLSHLTTEAQDRRFRRLDREPLRKVLERINDADRSVPEAVRKCLPEIERAARLVIATWEGGGRLLYAGAGTSGRLGVLDASELPPTFGLDHRRAVGLIAGGRPTLVRSCEGVEDSLADGARAVARARAGKRDCLIAIAASRRTPYTLGTLQAARRRGARTIFLVANPKPVEPSIEDADVVIAVVVGPEVVAGSTRMKAGTAQKLVLNMITTAAMVRLGKTYQNWMVDLQATSAKLRERSKRILSLAAGVDYDEATRLLKRARGSVKRALVMALTACTAREADRRLRAADGFVYKAVDR